MTAITYETVVVRSDGISIDLILWQRFRRPVPGLFERVMARTENQHLEHHGFVLPLGTVVTIPIEPAPIVETERVISLWD